MNLLQEFQINAVKTNILKHGQHLWGVFPSDADSHDDVFVYTIGNTEHKLPELLLIGNYPSNIVGGILNALGSIQRQRGFAFHDGEMVDINASKPVKIRNCTGPVKEEYTVQVGQFYGHEDYVVQQVLLCDAEGIYPDASGCAPQFRVPLT